MEPIEQLLHDLFSGNDELAESSAHQLAQYPEQALPLLLEKINSPDSDKRWWAIRALSLIPSAQAVQTFIEHLNDPDESVRQCAALALRYQPSFEAVPVLIQSLDSSNRLLARLAGDALIAVGHQAVPDLLLVMDSGSPRARLEAARALALIEDPRAIPAFYKALSEDSTLLEYWASEGLDRLGVGTVYISP
ncbi:MAG: HEAT repeat domain-containing protein [Anaerolineales bacterium]